MDQGAVFEGEEKMRVDKLWASLSQRAVEQGGLDIETFVRRGVEAGMSEAAIQDRLVADLEDGGPIFGKFFRALSTGAERTVVAGHQQGALVGDIDNDPDLKELLGLAGSDKIPIDGLTPEAADEIERNIEDSYEAMWVAELVNTCHLCLPLHGTVKTLKEWRENGLHPNTIHEMLGPSAAACHCHLVRESDAEDRTDVMAPLVRQKLETTTGLKGGRSTARKVTQVDVLKSWDEAQKAVQTKQGRRTMRLLGSARVAPGAQNFRALKPGYRELEPYDDNFKTPIERPALPTDSPERSVYTNDGPRKKKR